MSTVVLSRAPFDGRLTPFDVRLLQALDSKGRRRGEVCHSNATLAQLLGVAVRTVQASLKRLASAGYVARFRDYALRTRRRLVLLWRKALPDPPPTPPETGVSAPRKAPSLGARICAQSAHAAAPTAAPPYNPPEENLAKDNNHMVGLAPPLPREARPETAPPPPPSDAPSGVVVVPSLTTPETTEPEASPPQECPLSVPMPSTDPGPEAKAILLRELQDKARDCFRADCDAVVKAAVKRWGLRNVDGALDAALMASADGWGYMVGIFAKWERNGVTLPAPPKPKAKPSSLPPNPPKIVVVPPAEWPAEEVEGWRALLASTAPGMAQLARNKLAQWEAAVAARAEGGAA